MTGISSSVLFRRWTLSLARTCGALAASCLFIGACAAPQEQPSARSTLIVNAQVADGTGAALRDGAYADLVLFNPQTVIDKATFAEPTVLPEGIEKVFVNGELVWSDGTATWARPGR